MPYTYDIATGDNRSRTRLLIGDTDEKSGTFTDAEVDDALGRAGTVDGAAAILLRVLAAAMLRIGDPARSSTYIALAREYDQGIDTIEVGTFAPLPSEQGYVEVSNG